MFLFGLLLEMAALALLVHLQVIPNDVWELELASALEMMLMFSPLEFRMNDLLVVLRLMASLLVLIVPILPGVLLSAMRLAYLLLLCARAVLLMA